MAKIKIQNIGPIVEVEMELNNVNVIMGPQSCGKSTIAKIISYCQWFEKRFYLDGIFGISKDDFVDFYHFDNNYFNEDSIIEYESDFIQCKFKGKELLLEENTENNELKVLDYKKKKNIYVPAERNFVSVIPNLKKYKEANDNVLSFIYDWFSAKRVYTKENSLPILNFDINYYYSEGSDTDMLVLKDGKEIALQTASSGLHSIIPLFVIVEHLTNNIFKGKPPVSVMENDYLEDLIKIERNRKTKAEIKSLINSRTYYHSTNFIIEEPEQNLFPETQRDLIYHILQKLQSEREHSLTITTHSPYILYALNNCMMADVIKDKLKEEDKRRLSPNLSSIVPNKVSIYEIHDGKLKNIQQDDGLISANYFDNNMKELMDDFYVMLNYYDND